MPPLQGARNRHLFPAVRQEQGRRVQAVPRDLMAVDEAHRLRNGHEPSNVIAGAPRLALAGKHRLLLTATPLPNSLREFI